MKEKQRVVFIDSYINIEYINQIITNGQSIGDVLTVSNNKVTPSTAPLSDTLSHATLCTKMFLEHTTCACELFFINIWENDELNANINALLIALSWCLENDITLINLSLGTTRIADMPELFGIVNHLTEKNIITVAANSNARKLTFPASFDHVIGVKALESKSGEVGFIYQETSIDRIDVSCYVKDEVIAYKDHHYPLYAANSLATPIISAKICNFLNEGYHSIEQIKIKLEEDSLHASHNQDDKIYKKYFTKKIEIPVIAVMSDHHTELFDIVSLIQELLMGFSKQGYHGVCLSENDPTNLPNKALNLIDFENYSSVEKLHFYTHYCNIEYIIVKGSKKFLFEDLKTVEIDIILYHSEFNNLKEAPVITFSKHTDFEVLFDQIYSYLS